jgi:hypothetical protein
MDLLENFAKLEQEMKLSDKVSDKVLLMAISLVLLASMALLGVLLLTLDDPQAALSMVVVFPILGVQLFALSRARQRRAKIFEKYGFKCQSCNKTPYSLHSLNSTSKQFCPFCQLKYFP